MLLLCTVPDKLLIDKNPVISFHVAEDGFKPVDDADGNLVIDTSDGHQVDMELMLMLCLVVSNGSC